MFDFTNLNKYCLLTNKMTNFQKIISEIVAKEPLRQLGVAEKLGVTDAYVSNFVTGTRKLSKKIALKLEEVYGLNSSEMLAIQKREEAEELFMRPDKKTDALQQLDRAKKKSNGIHEANRNEGLEIDIENVHSVRAIVIPVKGQAGLQAHYFDEVLFKDLETEELLTTEKHLGKYFKIEVQGESMDDGTSKGLQPGDWAYCRSVPKQYWREKLYTHKWRIWCFFHNERGIIFKSIVSHDVDTGEMVLESLNPNKTLYPNFRINIGECSYVCNVVKKLSPL